MKTILISALLFLSATILLAQQSKYVTYNSLMKIKASKNGESVEWENKNVSVNFDYKTGEFKTVLTNADFMKPGEDISLTKDSQVVKRQLTFEGTFPISDIINQQQSTQNYNIELIFKAVELDISESILFNMLITRPESGASKSYRMFTLNGILYNDQINLPALKGYDNEIQLWLIFSGFMNIQ